MTIEIALFVCTAAVCAMLYLVVRELHQIGYLIWYSFYLPMEKDNETEGRDAG